MAPSLNHDVVYLLALEVVHGADGGRATLAALASVSRVVRAVVLPLLFRAVSWPHSSKADDVHGLAFYPESLWKYFRHFTLDWPHQWFESFPPKLGEISADPYSANYYTPRYLDLLVAALPALPITHFAIRCPFFAPLNLIFAVLDSRTIRSVALEDTPLDTPHLSLVASHPLPTLRELTLVAVGEALRVADGPVDPRVADVKALLRAWKQRYRARRPLRLPNERKTASALLTAHAPLLSTLRLSGILLCPDSIHACTFTRLTTFVLTGPPPDMEGTPFCEVLACMPCIEDVRLLLAAATDRPPMRIVPERAPVLPRTLTRLAVSTACELGGLLTHAPSGLRALALLSLSDWPRIPVGLHISEAIRLVRDAAESRAPLSTLRVTIEDSLTPEFCAEVAGRMPGLTALEVEVCGYHDGKTRHEWNEFVDALKPIGALRVLRLCVPFPEFDDDGPWVPLRTECARLFAESVPSLRRVGFQYRNRTGTHKYEDAWLEFAVRREGARVEVVPLPMASYVFPQVFPDVWTTDG